MKIFASPEFPSLDAEVIVHPAFPDPVLILDGWPCSAEEANELGYLDFVVEVSDQEMALLDRGGYAFSVGMPDFLEKQRSRSRFWAGVL